MLPCSLRASAIVVVMLAVVGLLVTPVDAHAQSTARWSIAGGLAWTGSYPIGDSTADLLQNAPGNPPPAFPLFRTKSSFESTPGIEGRFGFAIASRLTVEVGGAYSKPQIGVEISEDREGDATSFDGETIAQYVVDVSALWELPFNPTARLRPYVIGGGGYLRQLHDERTVVETGQLFHFGAGARVFLRGASAGHPFGVRADLQATFRRNGIDFEDQRRTMPTVSVLGFFGF
jgi:hypothetical protein